MKLLKDNVNINSSLIDDFYFENLTCINRLSIFKNEDYIFSKVNKIYKHTFKI